MFVFDTLSLLETYSQIVPNMLSVIDILDHATPYEDEDGIYNKGNIKYKVETALTSNGGILIPYNENGNLVVTLDGNMMVGNDENVFILEEGRFLYFKDEKNLSLGIINNTPEVFKYVDFIL